MAVSAKRCKAAIENERERTSAMALGTLVHALLLQDKHVVCRPVELKKPTKAQRAAKTRKPETETMIAAWDAFDAENVNSLVVNASELADAQRVADAVLDNPLAADLLKSATDREATIWFDRNGRACRTTPDLVGDGYFAEIKTTRDAQPDRFVWDFKRRLYHGQMSWHQTGLGDWRTPYVIAVESGPVPDCVVWEVDAPTMALGEQCCTLWFERLRACEQSNQWPGYAQSFLKLSLPGLEDELELTFADDEAAE